MEKYFCVIVAYFPDFAHLKKLCQVLLEQGYSVIVVDNTDQANWQPPEIEFIKYIKLGENKGIAAAQNIGVKQAIALGSTVVTFFDQDSHVEKEFLMNVKSAFHDSTIGVLAPVAMDKDSRIEYPSHSVTRIGGLRDVFASNKTSLVPVDVVIASGMSVRATVLKKVGLFQEAFFIDFVDIEWCLRCKKHGESIYVEPKNVLEHRIGCSTKKILGLPVLVHSPERTYYKVRNTFLLLRHGLPVLFCVSQILPSLLHNLLVSLVEKPRGLYVRYYLLGILHGIVGRENKC